MIAKTIARKAKSGWKMLRYNLHYWRIEKHPEHWTGLSHEFREPQVIVSLTTFPARIRIVHHTIITLLCQTKRPDRIVLWLAEEQFPQKEAGLPRKLLKLRDYGLEIRWCEDIRSYKKLIPSLEAFPDAILITVDDDMYYKPDTVERLMCAYEEDPHCVHCLVTTMMTVRGGAVVLDESGNKRYGKKAYLNKVLGVGGCLYPPQILYRDVLQKELFMALAPTSDDLWFWFMAVMNGAKIHHIGLDKPVYEYVGLSQHGPRLCKNNDAGEKLFFRHLEALLAYYPQAKQRMLTEEG